MDNENVVEVVEVADKETPKRKSKALPRKRKCQVVSYNKYMYTINRGYESYQNRINRGYESYQNRINRGYESYQNRINGRI